MGPACTEPHPRFSSPSKTPGSRVGGVSLTSVDRPGLLSPEPAPCRIRRAAAPVTGTALYRWACSLACGVESSYSDRVFLPELLMTHRYIKIGLTALVLAAAFGGLMWSTLREGTEYYKHVDEVMSSPAQWHDKQL